MKVLQLCLRIPYPAIDGGNIAMLNTAMALHAAGCDVSMLAVNTRKHYIEHTKLPEFFFKLFDFRSVYIDNSVTISGAIKNLFSSRSYNIERFISKNFENELIRLLNEQSFDVVLVDRKSTRLNSSHVSESRMPSSA